MLVFKKGKVHQYKMRDYMESNKLRWEVAELKTCKRKLTSSGFFKRDRRGDLIYASNNDPVITNMRGLFLSKFI